MFPMEVRGGKLQRKRSTGFMLHLLAGAATGQIPEEFAEHEVVRIERMNNDCPLCREGIPINDHGWHHIEGAPNLPCINEAPE